MRLMGLFLLAVLCGVQGARAQTGDLVATDALRVCADPANLPFSNERGEGYENRIAELLGRQLGLPVEYVFFPQVHGFVRNTLRARRCDLVMGTVAGDDLMQNTNPYYHTAYVIVVRRGAEVPETLQDPRMREMRLGAVARTPPVDLLVRHGLMTSTRFVALAVDTRVEAPAAELVQAVARGELDAALVWGPVAGWYAKVHGLALELRPLPSEPGATRTDFRITMGLRGQEVEWRRRVNAALRQVQPEIDAILQEYGVPLLDQQGRLRTP